jgi:hypothetical protein
LADEVGIGRHQPKLRTVRPDFDSGDEPLANVSEAINARKRARCDLCKVAIEKGDSIWTLRLFCWPTVTFAYHAACFPRSVYYRAYHEKYLPRRYAISDFASYRPQTPAWADVIQNFSLSRALTVIAAPGPNPMSNPDEGMTWAAFEAHHSTPLELMHILTWCGLKSAVLAIDPLPPETALVLGMFDDADYQRRAAEELAAPDLAAILTLLMAPRHSLSAMVRFIEFANRHSIFAEAVAAAIDVYRLDDIGRFSTAGSNGFAFWQRSHGNCRLCYFLIDKPERSARFRRFLEDQRLPGSHYAIYLRPFYWRATIFYCLRAGHRDAARALLDRMETEVDFYPTGSPKSFIADTKRMAANLAKI